MKIGVIGLGLIGGSIFKDLKKLDDYEVAAVSVSQNGKDIYKDYEVLKTCNLIFVCSAMNKTLGILDRLDEILPPETTVTDVCSLKRFVCAKQRPYQFVPSHPMAGTEHRGYENSKEGLFQGAVWVLTPVFGLDERLVKVIKQLGAKPIITTPEKHDEAAALISHMPMVIAQSIFKTAQENNLALEMAASGFRDMTRLALSNTEMASDMVQMNSDYIQTAILKLYKSIGDLTNSNYLAQINEIKLNRQSMFL